MQWLKSVSDGKGGYDTFKWDMKDVGMSIGFNLIKGVMLSILFAFLLPVLYLVFYPISHNKERLSGIVVSGVAILYLFIDYSQEWILFYGFNNTNNPNLISVYEWLLSFNLALIAINIIIYFFNGFFDKKPAVIFYTFVVATIYFIWYPLASIILF